MEAPPNTLNRTGTYVWKISGKRRREKKTNVGVGSREKVTEMGDQLAHKLKQKRDKGFKHLL